MTNEAITPIPEFGVDIEPVYASDDTATMTEKLRSFMTAAVRHHEEKHAGTEEDPDSIPCLALAVPCYLREDSREEYTAALTSTSTMLSVLNDECARLGYMLLSSTPAMFGISDDETTYPHHGDRSTGWKVEITHKSNAAKFFDGENNKMALTRLWLELSIKTHGPAYMHAMREVESGNEAQRQIQQIMSGKFQA